MANNAANARSSRAYCQRLEDQVAELYEALAASHESLATTEARVQQLENDNEELRRTNDSMSADLGRGGSDYERAMEKIGGSVDVPSHKDGEPTEEVLNVTDPVIHVDESGKPKSIYDLVVEYHRKHQVSSALIQEVLKDFSKVLAKTAEKEVAEKAEQRARTHRDKMQSAVQAGQATRIKEETNNAALLVLVKGYITAVNKAMKDMNTAAEEANRILTTRGKDRSSMNQSLIDALSSSTVQDLMSRIQALSSHNKTVNQQLSWFGQEAIQFADRWVSGCVAYWEDLLDDYRADR